jgi:hypothetical protein
MTNTTQPLARFYRMIDQARPPQRADRSACGTLPMRAVRYCEALTSATAYGWWAFSPLDMKLLWDGSDIFWQYDGSAEWLPLHDAAQFPHFAGTFDRAAPPDLAGTAPPFLTALPEPGSLQIWTGLFVRTAPDWHLLVRAPANLSGPGGIVLYEGIVESDTWFGPFFLTLRFTRSHTPIRLRPDFPLVQLQPIPRIAYAAETLDSSDFVPFINGMSANDWEDYRATIVTPNSDPDRPFGRYAVAARRAARGGTKCPAASRQPIAVSV